MASDVERLRAEYKRARANVSAKINRIKKAGQGEITGTSYDPRKPVGHEKRLNARQLQAGIAKMQAFNARSNKFVADARGNAISLMVASRVLSKVALRDIKATKFASSLGNKTFKGMEETAHEHQSKMRNKADGGRIGPFDTIGAKIDQVPSLRALKLLEQKVDKELSPNFRKEKEALARNNLKSAMELAGVDQDTISIIDDLDSEAFNLAWYGSPIPELAFAFYIEEQASTQPQEREEALRLNARSNNLRELLIEARTDQTERRNNLQAAKQAGSKAKATKRAPRKG